MQQFLRVLKVVGAATCLADVGAAFAMDAASSPDAWSRGPWRWGTWEVDISCFENDQPGGSAKGVQVNTLLANVERERHVGARCGWAALLPGTRGLGYAGGQRRTPILLSTPMT
jgi:hypothetical protein